MPDRINAIQQTEVLHLKTVKTIKLTTANNQKHSGIPTTEPPDFSCAAKAHATMIKLFQDNFCDLKRVIFKRIIAFSIFQSSHFRKITGTFYYSVNSPLKTNLSISLCLGV